MNEHAFVFESAGKQLVGISHPVAIGSDDSVGVLIVVGGPQTRVGSHRQFVLLARYLAGNGIPAMRFDYSGMGDSQGIEADFMAIGEDIHQACRAFKQQCGVKRIVLWGLCDAASSSLLYARSHQTDDVLGMILLNPWVRSEQGEAKAIVKHYYLNRLKDKAFWRKVFSLKFNYSGALKSLTSNLRKASSTRENSEVPEAAQTNEDNYIEHMLEGLQLFDGPVMLVISGEDLTASEFLDLVGSSSDWKTSLAKNEKRRLTIETANHTFSSKQWRNEVEVACLDWIRSLR